MERQGEEVHLNETEATAGVKAQGVRYVLGYLAPAGRDRHVRHLDPGTRSSLNRPTALTAGQGGQRHSAVHP